MLCEVCKSSGAIEVCSWPEMTMVLKRMEDARHGDIWITKEKALRLRARIEEIQTGAPGEKDARGLTFWVKIPGYPKPYPYFRYFGTTVPTEGLAPCGVACCPSCFREVGPGRVYCQRH